MADTVEEVMDITEENPKQSEEPAVETIEDDDVNVEEGGGNTNGELDVAKMKVTELRDQLKQRGLDTKGNKAALVERLKESLNAEALEGGDDDDGAGATGDEVLEEEKTEDGEGKETAMEVDEKKEEAKQEETKQEETKKEEGKKDEKKEETKEEKKEESKEEKKEEPKEEKKEEEEIVEVEDPPPSELPKFWKAIKDNPGDFTGWTYLLQYVEQKNHLKSVQDAFNAFFERYPYCYGYWKKFADTERRHGNMEAAKEIFERGLKSIALSTDLWIQYINFTGLMYEGKPEKAEKVREMYKRAIDTCGTEFRSDKLWDHYIKFETDHKEWHNVTAIYDKLFTIPTQSYTKHFDNFKTFVEKHHPKDIISLDEFIKFRLEVVAEKGTVEETEGPIEGGDEDDEVPPGCDEAPPPGVDGPKDVQSKPITDEENKAIQQKIIAIREESHKKNEVEVTKRWTFEEGIRRPYFHAKALERGQLKNWKEYLDFEIANGTHERVVVLFERCLIACALYEDFWIKYAKYMETHKKAEVSDIYKRACTIHLMKKPNIHMHWAAFEEEQGNIGTARDVLAKLEENLPNLVMITQERINLERRHGNNDNVLKLYEEHIKDASNEKISSFYSIRLARYLSRVLGNQDKAQTIIEAAVEKDKENIQLYLQLFDLELQKKPFDEDSILCLFDVVQELPFDTATKVRFSHRRLEFLLDFGTDVTKLHSAQEEHQKLLKQKDDDQKAAIAAASQEVAKKRASDTSSNSSSVPVKKSRPEGREAARVYHQQQQQNFPPQNQGYGYNQGQWGNFQPDAPGQDDIIIIDDDKGSNSNDDLWAWSIDDNLNDDRKRRHEGSRSRESSRRHSRSRERHRSRSPRSRRRSRSPLRHSGSGRFRSPRRRSRSHSPQRRPRSPGRARSPRRKSRNPHQRCRSPHQSSSAASSPASSQKSAASSSSTKPKKTPAPAEDVKNAWQGAAATLRLLTSDSASQGSEPEVTEVREKSSSPEIEEVMQVEGFIHNMTPIKVGKNNKYFYAILQVSQKDYINMICFSTEQHQLLMSMARSKNALKFTNISFNDRRTGSGGKDATVNTHTQISKTPVKFYATKPFWSHLANFCSLKNAETRVNDGDHVHVAVTVQSCNNKAVEQVVRGNEVERKDYVITDKSGNITLSTWGEYTEILQIGKTYMIGNVTVKLHKGVKVLNTNIRTSIIEGIWDREKHELDYTVVFPAMYPEDGGNSLESQKKNALNQQPGLPGRGLLGHSPGRSSRDSSREGGDYYGGSSHHSGHSQSNPYQNYPQQWGNYQQNYYGGSS